MKEFFKGYITKIKNIFGLIFTKISNVLIKIDDYLSRYILYLNLQICVLYIALGIVTVAVGIILPTRRLIRYLKIKEAIRGLVAHFIILIKKFIKYIKHLGARYKYGRKGLKDFYKNS